MATNDWTLYQKTMDFLRLRKRAYQFTFGNPKDNEALKDLAKFARVGRTPFHESQRKTDVLIGRQEMFFRIIEHLKLQPDELYDIYNQPSTIQPRKE